MLARRAPKEPTPPARARGVALAHLLPFALLVMEFCWIYPWIMLLGAPLAPRPLLSPLSALLLVGGAAAGTRILVAQPWTLQAIRLTLLGVGVAAGLAAVKSVHYPTASPWDPRWLASLLRGVHDLFPVVSPPAATALLVLLLWWRGLVLGTRDYNYYVVESAFEGGVGAIVLFAVVVAVAGEGGGPGRAAAPYFLAFFFLGFCHLALARLLAIREQSLVEEGQALSLNRHWLTLVAMAIGGAVLMAVALSGILSADVWRHLAPALSLLLPVVEAIFLILFYVAAIVARIVIFLLEQLGRLRLFPRMETQSFSDGIRSILQDLALSPEAVSRARWGLVGLGLFVVLVLMALAIVRLRKRPRAADEDERESVWSAPAIVRPLAALARAAWRWLRRRQGAPRDLPEVLSIRMLYRRVLRLGADLGAPRRRDQTPYEYVPRLAAALPEAEADLRAVTESYVRARYGTRRPSAAEVQAARARVARIVEVWRRLPAGEGDTRKEGGAGDRARR